MPERAREIPRRRAGAASARDQAPPTIDAPPGAPATVSVIIPVLHDDPGLDEIHWAYRAALERPGRELEFVYVLDRRARAAHGALRRLKVQGEPLTAFVVTRWEDEAAALRVGFQHASGDVVLTLPAHLQVEPEDLPAVLDALDDSDMVAGRRTGLARTVEATVFHWLIRTAFGHAFGDLVCRVRAYRRPVLEELAGYGTQPHFLPLLASERGFRIREVEVRKGTDGGADGGFRLLGRLRLTLDVLSYYMVLKFIRRPLRFFGAIGLPLLAAGVLYTGWLAFARLVLDVPLADRPALILGVLMIVLGIQVLALGLIGEIIIFASGKRIKDYTIDRILE